MPKNTQKRISFYPVQTRMANHAKSHPSFYILYEKDKNRNRIEATKAIDIIPINKKGPQYGGCRISAFQEWPEFSMLHQARETTLEIESIQTGLAKAKAFDYKLSTHQPANKDKPCKHLQNMRQCLIHWRKIYETRSRQKHGLAEKCRTMPTNNRQCNKYFFRRIVPASPTILASIYIAIVKDVENSGDHKSISFYFIIQVWRKFFARAMPHIYQYFVK